MDEQSGESKEEEVVGEVIGESEMEELIPEWRWRRDKESWFQRQGEAWRKEPSVIFRENDVCGRARVTTDEERVLQGRWTEMRLRMYGGWVVVRTLSVSGRSLYSMRSVILSQCRERRLGVIWQDSGALTTVRAREFWICWRPNNWELGSSYWAVLFDVIFLYFLFAGHALDSADHLVSFWAHLRTLIYRIVSYLWWGELQ